jgi:hypothetical protein
MFGVEAFDVRLMLRIVVVILCRANAQRFFTQISFSRLQQMLMAVRRNLWRRSTVFTYANLWAASRRRVQATQA